MFSGTLIFMKIKLIEFLQKSKPTPSNIPVISIETDFFKSSLMNSLMEHPSGENCLNQCTFINYTNR